MDRTNFLRPLTSAFLLAVVPAFAACNGRVISLGNTGDTLQPVTGGAAVVAQTPVSCPSGWAHPNVCCTASPSSTPSCGAWEENPFRACEPGATTYPDPLSCCSLSDPKKCTDAPSSTPVTTPPPPPYGCGYACPPGWWAQAAGAITPEGPEGAMCCMTTPSGGTECVAQAGAGGVLSSPPSGSSSGSSSGSPSTGTCGYAGGGSSSGGGTNGGGPIAIDAGPPPGPADASAPPIDGGSDDGGIVPVPPADAGVGVIDDGGCTLDDAGSPYPIGYDGGPASLCGACPTGWTEDTVQPELCCQDASDGTRLCFSQASGSATSTGNPSGGSTSPGQPSSGWGSGGGSSADGGASGPSCSGSDNSCGCSNTVNGHAYALSCTRESNGAITCTCDVDGSPTGSVPSVASCQDSNAVQGAYTASSGCGFP